MITERKRDSSIVTNLILLITALVSDTQNRIINEIS